MNAPTAARDARHPFRGIALRITGVVALLCLGFALTSWWELSILRSRIQDLHLAAEHQAAEHLDGLLELESQPCRAFASSYSWWDELVTATSAGDTAWMTTNIDPSLKDFLLDAAVVINSAGNVIHAAGIELAAAQRIAAAIDLTVVNAARTAWRHVLVDGTASDVACATIHPTADTARRTPPRGTLLGIRHWTAGRITNIARLSGGSIVLDPARTAARTGPSPVTDLRIQHVMADHRGHLVGVLKSSQAMPSLAALATQSDEQLLLSAIFGISALLCLSAFGLFLIGRPLKQLAECVAHQDAATARNLSRRQDELGLVADAVAKSIEQQSHLSAEVDQRRQAEESLREANTRLNSDLQHRELAEQALREAEMRNSLALQGGNLCLWELFLQEGRWGTDRSWLSFLGITLDPSVPDTTAWESVIAPEGLADLHERIARIRSGTTDHIESTFLVQRDDGGRVWVLLRGMVVERDAAGEPSRLAGTMLDVTRWREMEEQLRQSQKMESIGQLAAGIAHEINTPIQFIGDNTRFAAESFTTLMKLVGEHAALAASHPDPAVRDRVAAANDAADFPYLAAEVPKAVEQTLEGVDRVASIVRAMKEFSHPGSTELAPCDLNHLVENAVIISRNTWRYVAELTTGFDASLPLVPLAAGDFNQVLLNLIVNAAQAVEDAQSKLGKKPPGRITVTTSRTDTQAILRISDDGGGIPEDIRERIYDPFFTTKEVGRGTGQGLTIARSIIVDRHHGLIACESAVGVGTTFTVSLPLVRQEA